MGNNVGQRGRRVSVVEPAGYGSKGSLTGSTGSSEETASLLINGQLNNQTNNISNKPNSTTSSSNNSSQISINNGTNGTGNNRPGFSPTYSYTADEMAVINRPPFAFRAVTMSPGDHTMIVNMSELRRLLTRPDVRDKPVVVLSVAGLLRRGKSFLLNFIIRYLETLNTNNNNNSNKFNNENGYRRHFPLKKLRSGQNGSSKWLKTESALLISKKNKQHMPKWQKNDQASSRINGLETSSANSIYMWSKPYFRHVPGVGEIVILLLEAQTGTFECPLTAKDCATIVAMSTMLSSVQVFNVQGGVDESDLQHLQMFAEYGRSVLADLRTKPFQNLVFLVRDWSRPYEFTYGFEGGQRYLADLRGGSLPSAINSPRVSRDSPPRGGIRRHLDLERIWQRIDDCFESVSCFLMPHPGTVVATSEKYSGPLKHIDPIFLDNMRNFVPKLLSEEELELKTINSNPVTCAGLFEFMTKYAETLQTNSLPTIPDSLVASAAHLHYWSVFDAAKTLYEEEMEKIVDLTSPTVPITVEQLKIEHGKVMSVASQLLLHDKNLVDDEQLRELYVRRLAKFAAKRFEHYAKLVDGKNQTVAKSTVNPNGNGNMAHTSTLTNLKATTSQKVNEVQKNRLALKRQLMNAATYGAMIVLCLAIIAIIGLPVLVSVLVAGSLFYFSRQRS